MTRGLWVSCAALGGVLLLGLGYLLVGLVQVDPLHPPYQVRVVLPHSGGLLERSNVSLRGDVVGRVTEIELADDGGVEVELEIKDDVKIPADTNIVVGALSLAGEQYVDFRPRTESGPVLEDGDLVDPHHLSMPVPFSKLLTDLVAFADDLDPRDLRTIGRELAIAVGGTGKDLRRLFANASTLMGVLEKSLPDTLGLIDSSAAVLDLIGDSGTELETIGRSSRIVARALRRSDGDFRAVLRRGPPTLEQFTRLLRDTREPFEQGLAAWQPLLAVASPNTPAIAALFPSIEFGAGRAAQVVSTGSIAILLDFSANRVCDYNTPYRSPTIGGSPPVRLYRYCDKYHPDLLQRGPYYAPRRPGDRTATAPPGVTGNETSEDRP